MFERYTDDARRVIVSALAAAQRLAAHSIDTEHLLLGTIETRNVLIRQLARVHGLDLKAAASEIELNYKREGSKVSEYVDVPLTPAAMAVLKYAEDEADLMKDPHIGPEHLFLALIRYEGGIAGSILKEHGLTIEGAREEMSRLKR
jgi:ATP-dependent Clp protease ATP-binding subunit ClpC